MITLGELQRQLMAIRQQDGVTDDSPIIVEGYDEDDNFFVQACLESAKTERRCEEEGEPQGVYLNLCEAEVLAR